MSIHRVPRYDSASLENPSPDEKKRQTKRLFCALARCNRLFVTSKAKPHRAIKPCGIRSSNYWGGWVRTTNLLVNSQALCRLSYAPSPINAANPSGVRRVEPTDEARREGSYGGVPTEGDQTTTSNSLITLSTHP